MDMATVRFDDEALGECSKMLGTKEAISTMIGKKRTMAARY